MLRHLGTHRRYLKEQCLYHKNACQGAPRTQQMTGRERWVWKELFIHQDYPSVEHYFQVRRLPCPTLKCKAVLSSYVNNDFEGC